MKNNENKKFTVINEDWSTKYATDCKVEIDEYIEKNKKDIFQVIYQEKPNSPFHVYFMN